jgi:hypothetical protein
MAIVVVHGLVHSFDVALELGVVSFGCVGDVLGRCDESFNFSDKAYNMRGWGPNAALVGGPPVHGSPVLQYLDFFGWCNPPPGLFVEVAPKVRQPVVEGGGWRPDDLVGAKDGPAAEDLFRTAKGDRLRR